MECKNHAGIKADYICKACGNPICLQCTVELNSKHYCRECLEKMVESGPKEHITCRRAGKSRLLTFFLSIIPGAGHMYLGLINRGLVTMCLFFASLFLVIMFSDAPAMSWFPGFFIPTLSVVFVFYSIFDAVETVNRINSGEAGPDIGPLEFEAIRFKLRDRKKLIGYILVISGFIPICNMLLEFLEKILMDTFNVEIPLTSLLLALALVASGIYLIRKGRIR